MGYWTAYALNIFRPRELQNDANKDCHLLKEIEKINPRFEGDLTFGMEVYDTWGNHDQDMIALSQKFPDLIFELYGNGEGSDDHWVSYYKNGEHQLCHGSIVYEECELSKEAAGWC